MANPPSGPPRSYGGPASTFTPPSKAAERGRPKAGPASPDEIHRRLDAYEQHLKTEHARIEHVRKVVPRGTSSAPNVARGSSSTAKKTDRGGANLRVEKALKDSGA